MKVVFVDGESREVSDLMKLWLESAGSNGKSSVTVKVTDPSEEAARLISSPAGSVLPELTLVRERIDTTEMEESSNIQVFASTCASEWDLEKIKTMYAYVNDGSRTALEVIANHTPYPCPFKAVRQVIEAKKLVFSSCLISYGQYCTRENLINCIRRNPGDYYYMPKVIADLIQEAITYFESHAHELERERDQNKIKIG